MSDKHVIRYLDITDQPQTLPPALKIFDLTGKVAVVTGASSGLGKGDGKGPGHGRREGDARRTRRASAGPRQSASFRFSMWTM